MKLSFDLLNNESKLPLKMHNMILLENFAYHNPSMKVMVDTGATIPVWVSSINLLKVFFPMAYEADYRGLLRGFGGNGAVVPMFIIPSYRLRDKKGKEIEFVDLPIMVSTKDYSYDMIISFSMFQSLNYSYKYFNESTKKEHKTPKFRIKTNRNKFGFGKRFVDGADVDESFQFRLLGDMYALAQDDG